MGATVNFCVLCGFDGSDGFVGVGGSVGWFGFCFWGLVHCWERSLCGVVCMCWGVGIAVGGSVVVRWESVALGGKRCLCCWSLQVLYGPVSRFQFLGDAMP